MVMSQHRWSEQDSLKSWDWGHKMRKNHTRFCIMQHVSKKRTFVCAPASWTWSIRCWHPSDTAHHWESQCRPSCYPFQNVSHHHWQTPANASSHSSSLSCPIRKHIILFILLLVSPEMNQLTKEVVGGTTQNHRRTFMFKSPRKFFN